MISAPDIACLQDRRKPTPRFGFGGLFRRKERWSLSSRGWALSLVATVLLVMATGAGIHPFLAVTARQDANVLVVEGWIPNYALEESIAEFKTGSYGLVVTVGCQILSGVNVAEGDDQASYAAKRLTWLGLPREVVRAAPSSAKYRDRTYASALALRQWSEANNAPFSSFNLVTLGPHARRSRLLFEKAFGGKVRVGIISIENREYSPNRWWTRSEGVKEVVGEAIGYLYARFFSPRGQTSMSQAQ